MKTEKNKKLISLAVAAVVTGSIAAPAMAVLEEVVVTAIKREQTLQDIPVSIQFFCFSLLFALRIKY